MCIRSQCEGHVATVFLSPDEIKRLPTDARLLTPEEYADKRGIDALSLGLG